MTAAVKAVLEQAMQLSPEERAEVANALDGMSADAPALSPDDLATAWRPELDQVCDPTWLHRAPLIAE